MCWLRPCGSAVPGSKELSKHARKHGYQTINWYLYLYLSDRSQCVFVKIFLSKSAGLSFGILQGSAAGPITCCIHTLLLVVILRFHKLQYHIYAESRVE